MQQVVYSPNVLNALIYNMKLRAQLIYFYRSTSHCMIFSPIDTIKISLITLLSIFARKGWTLSIIMYSWYYVTYFFCTPPHLHDAQIMFISLSQD